MPIWILQRMYFAKAYEARNFVIRAASAHKARKLASAAAGKERPGDWTDPRRTTCSRVKDTDKEKIILADYKLV